ncbi:fatty acyl-CoA reductase wat-like [Neodiprion fabricii]|uniref:fatty acyl-CoA reductase wat-like n=1 Tax=Neodiprion fabricii TaxID=2872261 RepID=UPI001ED9634E|nr:fatty acyl-CoA reductase wat-like [Neodiprion fabricii]
MSQIQQFNVGQNIFITGQTGFMGKILTEKLIPSYREIGPIYLLIREKKGKSVEERRDALLVEPVIFAMENFGYFSKIFDVLRNDYPNFSEKIVCIVGDIAEESLGLMLTDFARLVDEVSVIFHLAATVRFNEKLEVALAINVNSVKSVIDVARECKNLKVGVYVSTAYSHCVRKSIDEKLYPSSCASYEEVKGIISKAKANELSEDMTEAHFKDVSVYNYVSGSETPITWRQCDSKSSVALRSYPTEKAIYYSFYIDTKSRLLFYILEICFHFFPALIIDNVARLMGKEPQ